MERERAKLLRLARAAASSRAARLVGAALGAGLLALLLLRLRALWDAHPVSIEGSDGAVLLAAAVLVSAAGVFAHAQVWRYLLALLGFRAPARIYAAYFAGQLGKYLPGSAWQYVARAALLRQLGAPLRLTSYSLVVETLLSALAACTLAPAIGGTVGVLAAAALVAGAALLAGALWLLRTRLRAPAARLLARLELPPAALRPGFLLRAAAAYLGVWLIFGLAFWLLAAALVGASAGELPLYAGCFGLAYAAGFSFVFAPGGIGIRELVLVALLRNRIGEPEAIALAACSRIIFTGIDGVGGGAALLAYGGLHAAAARVRAAARPQEPPVAERPLEL